MVDQTPGRMPGSMGGSMLATRAVPLRMQDRMPVCVLQLRLDLHRLAGRLPGDGGPDPILAFVTATDQAGRPVAGSQ